MNTSLKLLSKCLSNLVCRVAYMEGIKYVTLIEINPVVIEIRGVENGQLAVPVNNILVCHTAFLATYTQPCVLICHKYYSDNHLYINFTVKCHSQATKLRKSFTHLATQIYNFKKVEGIICLHRYMPQKYLMKETIHFLFKT